MISVWLQKKKSVISYAIFVQLYCALTWSLYLIIWAYVFDRTISFRTQEIWQLLDGEARDVEAVLEAHFYLYCKIFCYAEAKMVTPFMFVSSVLVVSLQYLLRFIADKFWMRKWTLTSMLFSDTGMNIYSSVLEVCTKFRSCSFMADSMRWKFMLLPAGIVIHSFLLPLVPALVFM